MAHYLLDTNIIRYYIDRSSPYHPQANQFIHQCRINGDSIFISTTTRNELKRQDITLPTTQKQLLRLFIKALNPIAPEDYEDRRATNLRRFATWLQAHHRHTHCRQSPGIPALADAQICLVGIQEKMTIVTNNIKDFSIVRFFGINLYNPVTGKHYPVIPLTKQKPHYWDISSVIYIDNV